MYCGVNRVTSELSILDPLLEAVPPIFEKKQIVINDNLEDIPERRDHPCCGSGIDITGF